jgi:predicted DNA-binding transcriptional regulator AlpA
MCGLSRSTIWRLQRAGQFLQRCRIAPGAVGWLHDDIDAWLRQVASQRDALR